LDAALVAYAGIAAAGAVILIALYRSPQTRPLTASGYTAMAVALALLTAVGMAGGVAAASKASSGVVVDSMRGVVEGVYKAQVWPQSGVGLVNSSEAAGLLSGKALEAYRMAEKAVLGGLNTRGCRLEAEAYALIEVSHARSPQGIPGGGVMLILDPNVKPWPCSNSGGARDPGGHAEGCPRG
jgi:hypothetical protein